MGRERWGALSPSWSPAAALGAVVLLGGGWLLRTHVFPPALVDIAFAQDQSRIDAGAGRVIIEIRRGAMRDSTAQVQARFIDGDAKAGVDFEVPAGLVVLKPGQTEARIAVPILPDTLIGKGERHFSVELANVLGRPRHTVVIAPKPMDTTAQVQLEQMVLGASRIAADIAGLVVKKETAEQLLADFRDNETVFQESQRQMRDAADNLVRAREAYLLAMKGLQTQAPQQVLGTIGRLAPDLERRAFRQQARVLPVMGQQYQELVKGQSIDMDRWVSQLGMTIERIPGAGKRPAQVL